MVSMVVLFRIHLPAVGSNIYQEEVAELIEVSARYYQMLESKNPTAVKIDTIEKIAKAFKIRPAKLFSF